MTSVSASPSDLTGRRLGALLVGYLGVVIGVITLAPFRFAVPADWVAHWIVLDGGWVPDLLLNVALFMPVGLALHRTLRRTTTTVVIAAALGSVTIEVLQLFLLPRYSTVSDVLANVTGAALGAAVSGLIDRRVGTGQAFVGRLLLDLPLMGIMYLLLPLLWLDALSAAGQPARAWLVVPLGVVGALTLAAVARSVPEAASRGVGRNVVLAAAIWFAVGAVPALRINPIAAAVGLVAVILTAAAGQAIWHRAVQRDRRLEPQVVRVIIPIMFVYLAGLIMAPGTVLIGEGEPDARVALLRWIEHLAAVATLGYLLAEWRGRRGEGELRSVAIPVAFVVVLDAALAVIGPATVRVDLLVVASAAAGIGAILYRRQRDHIIALSGTGG